MGAAAKPVLTVYTYDSFTAPWGAAAKVKEVFEKECNCTLHFVSASSAIGALRKIQLEGVQSSADILLGLDTSTMEMAKKTALFAPHDLNLSSVSLPVTYKDETFVPYDYSYFAFVYDRHRLTEVPYSFEALAKLPDRYKIIIQDPRSATPGMGLLLWIKSVYGDKAGSYWHRLSPHILTITKGWSEAYNLFLKGEADMVLSYTTSPAYHQYEENRTDIQAALFDEGHYGQIEVAAMLKRTHHPKLARQFLQFLLSDRFAAIITMTNWSYPVVTPPQGLPEVFQHLPRPKKMLLMDPKEVEDHRKVYIREWLDAIRQW
jgi:thiamine transport system substrate-binding protein